MLFVVVVLLFIVVCCNWLLSCWCVVVGCCRCGVSLSIVVWCVVVCYWLLLFVDCCWLLLVVVVC